MSLNKNSLGSLSVDVLPDCYQIAETPPQLPISPDLAQTRSKMPAASVVMTASESSSDHAK